MRKRFICVLLVVSVVVMLSVPVLAAVSLKDRKDVIDSKISTLPSGSVPSEYGYVAVLVHRTNNSPLGVIFSRSSMINVGDTVYYSYYNPYGANLGASLHTVSDISVTSTSITIAMSGISNSMFYGYYIADRSTCEIVGVDDGLYAYLDDVPSSGGATGDYGDVVSALRTGDVVDVISFGYGNFAKNIIVVLPQILGVFMLVIVSKFIPRIMDKFRR